MEEDKPEIKLTNSGLHLEHFSINYLSLFINQLVDDAEKIEEVVGISFLDQTSSSKLELSNEEIARQKSEHEKWDEEALVENEETIDKRHSGILIFDR